MFNWFCLFPHPLGDTLHRLAAVVVLAKGGESDVAFARRTESYARGAHHAGSVEHLFEELPAGGVARGLHPEIRCILAAVDTETEAMKLCPHVVGVLHIVGDGGLHSTTSVNKNRA